MANAQQLSAYFASFGFKLDMKSVGAVRTQITKVKQMLERNLQLTMVVTKVKLGSKRQLNADIKRQMATFGGVTLKISSFKIDAAALRAAVQAAYDRGVTLTINPRVNRQGGGGGGSGGGLNNTMLNSRFNNIPRVLDRLGSGVATMATGMGLWELNRISEDLQTSKVALGTITNGRGDEAYNWLKERGRERGFDYSSQLPVFSSYMAASINKQGYEGSLGSFAKLTDYGLTHGADKEGLKRAMTAIGQMWSKGQIHQEELKGQLSEARGFAGAREHFATAWQDFTGGKLTGQKAEAALLKAMEKGLVKSADILPLVIEKMGIKAAGGIEAYKKTTTYAHGRFDTGFKESIELFGKGGFDEGMRNFFLTLAKHMEDNQEGITKLGKAFKYGMQILLSFIETGISFIRMLNDFSSSMTGVLIIMAPLMRIFGKWGMVLTGIMLAVEDIKVYIEGGNSAIGALLGYLEALVGFNLDPLALAFAGLGIAILAAFAPVTAFILGLAAIVEAYKAMQAEKAAADPLKEGYNSNTLYTSKQVKDLALAQSEREAKNSGRIGRAVIGASNFLSYAGEKISGYSFSPTSQSQVDAYTAANESYKRGKITADQLEAMGRQMELGLTSPSRIKGMLAARETDPSIFPNSNKQVPQTINVTIDGTASNQTFSFIIPEAFSKFANGTPTPANITPTP